MSIDALPILGQTSQETSQEMLGNWLDQITDDEIATARQLSLVPLSWRLLLSVCNRWHRFPPR